MNGRRWPRKVKAIKVEGQLGRGSSKFGWFDVGKRALAVTDVGAGGNANSEKKECVEITCDGVIVLALSEEDKRLHVIGCLY